jgi:hypothetical protein
MFIQSYKSTYLYFGKESRVASQLYRLLILIIYILKYLMVRVQYSLNKRNELLQILEYYRVLISFMLTGINDPQNPYAVKLDIESSDESVRAL